MDKGQHKNTCLCLDWRADVSVLFTIMVLLYIVIVFLNAVASFLAGYIIIIKFTSKYFYFPHVCMFYFLKTEILSCMWLPFIISSTIAVA